MSAKISPWHSLKTRATILTLVVLVLGIWTLPFFATRLLKADWERTLGAQQFSAVSSMAHEVNDGLSDRMQALQAIAKQVTPAMLQDTPKLQTWLEQRPVLPILFNGGVWVAAAEGVAIAEVPLSARRIGTSYRNMEPVISVLQSGQAVISHPLLGKKRQLPLFSIVVPILDAQGKVAGVLSGVTDLDKPNFLDQIANGRHGKTGNYSLVSIQRRQVIAASEKGDIMKLLPAVGVSAWVDRFVQGHEGSVVYTDHTGVELLSSVKTVPVAGWFVQIALPTQEAFAPIRDMQQRIFLAALLLTLLTSALIWWILKRQLSPLVETADAMRSLAQANFVQPLPVTRQDEIGQLVGGFNQLLEKYQQREATLRASEAFKNTVLNSLDAAIAVVDSHGVIVAVNDRWQQVALENGLEPGKPAPNTGVGTNYFSVCELSGETCTGNGPDVGAGLKAVLDGRLPRFYLDYACDFPAQTRWFTITIMPLGQAGAGGAVITHTDITERRKDQNHLARMNKRMSVLIEAIPDPIFFKDGTGRWLITNEPAKQLYRLHSIDWEGKTEAELCELQPEFRADHQACLITDGQAWQNNAMSIFSETVVNARGVAQHFEVRKIPIFDENGSRQSLVIIGRDITELKNSEETLRIAATAFEAQQGMLITDAKRTILRVNQAFTQITGYSAEEVLGKSPDILASGRHDQAYYAVMSKVLETEGAWAGEIWNRRKNGDIYPEWLSISAVKNSAGLTTHYVGIFSDITEHIRAQAQIDALAFYDPLTHLPNRRLLLDRLDQTLHASKRRAGKNALLFVDLDNFKTLNDTLGHHQGDLLLVQVAQRLKTAIREGDTVARLGSDEFVVMLENLSKDDIEAATQAETVGGNILRAFQHDFPLDYGAHHSTPSIGITLFGSEPLVGHEEPLKRAELAMFQAKAAGRNTLRFFDARMQAEVSARAVLEADLREAAQQQQFLLHYQPQVVGAGRITGVEALVRWQHPERGMVSPAEFIPLAEECGLILPIGQWVLDTACTQLAVWAGQPDLAHLTMAVNVSARQFKQAGFVDSVLTTLERTQANPKRLKLELTESMLVDDVEAIIAKMGTLQNIGVSFSLDDFGTGYSSLAYLKRLPLNQLKIDQGFVQNIVTDPNDAAIAKMVVVLAESMGLSVIAEGVELQAQADFLAHQGCHAYQGYLFGKPLPVDALEALVCGR
jgi:diguanylate cyclase (GGDEF)-like protein/PAS domain S-box-containing protein